MTMIALRRRAAARRSEKETTARLRQLENGALRAIENQSSSWRWRDDLRSYLQGLKLDALNILAAEAKDERVRTSARYEQENREYLRKAR